MPKQGEFAGTRRFRILRKIGQGGMGVVYEAEDTERKIRVALKTLGFVTPSALYRFKQEFRSISDIVHPNLVSLYEFFAEGDVWFFTMEFIEGQGFVESTRPAVSIHPVAGTAGTTRDSLLLTRDSPTASASDLPASAAALAGAGHSRPAPPADVERTRSLARQVAAGLCAVHAAGKLHRDVKSSNVLVTPQGRAVVLDFGLAAEIEEANLESASGEIVGTVDYMSPEQISGKPLSPASDWYSFGAMLYEALTGQMPFDGSRSEAIRRRLETEPPPPSQIVSGIPGELDRLCTELLRRNPKDRPSGAEVLARLAPVQHAVTAAAFVGRRNEQELLLQAYSTARQGKSAVALVHGPSGVGKSALVQHFLDLDELRDALILRGRCYERESVPYKAFDSAVDMLCRYLRREAASVQALLPEDIAPLTQIFPVFRQIDQIAEMPAASRDPGDVQDLRRRAFQGFRELLVRLRQQRQVILCLDDLHWADIESARLLSALLAPPDPPAILLCCSFRSEYEQRSEFLKMLLAQEARGVFEQFDIPLKPLESAEALELARTLVAPRNVQTTEGAERIAQESGGNPYFLCELARGLRESMSPGGPGDGALSLDQIIWQRVRTLPESVQHLLYVVALFGQPLAQADAYEAAGFATRDPSLLGSLRNQNLVRTSGMQELDSVEAFHDRVRETVLGHLAAEQRRPIHAKLAATLERSGRADAETLAIHFEGAGDLAKAGSQYEIAAEQASATLAFDRAAKLYEHLLKLREHPPEVRSVLESKLAHALANAGRGLRAAQAYERAAQSAAPQQRLQLERSAAFQYCSSGHLEEGLSIFRRILGRVGLRLSSPKMSVLKFAWHLLQLRRHGQHFHERPPAEISAHALEQFDSAWAVAAPMVQVDLLRSLDFGTLSLLLALRAGDPARLVRATQTGAYLISVQGPQGRRMADWLVEQSEHYAVRLEDPHLRASVALSRTGIAYIGAQWRAACKHSLAAEQILTRECKGTRWDIASLWTIYIYALWTLGEFAELGQRSRELLRTAEEREDLYSYANIAVFCEPLRYLAADQPQPAREAVGKGLERWPYRGFHLQHVMAAQARVWIDFYEGRGAESLQSVEKTWQLLHDNSFHNHPNLSTIWQDQLARTALAAAAVSGPKGRDRYLRLAVKVAQKLAANRFPWKQATACVIRAGITAVRGDRQAAADSMLEAARRFDAQDMACYAASARRYAGEWQGREAGRELVAQADEWMRRQNIVRPDRMAAAHVGGYLDSF